MPSTEVTTLSNGVKVASRDVAGDHTVSVSVCVGSGTRDEKGVQGLNSILAEMAFTTTATRSTARIIHEAEDIGATYGAVAGRDSMTVSMSTMRGNATTVVSSLFDVVTGRSFRYVAVFFAPPAPRRAVRAAAAACRARASSLLPASPPALPPPPPIRPALRHFCRPALSWRTRVRFCCGLASSCTALHPLLLNSLSLPRLPHCPAAVTEARYHISSTLSLTHTHPLALAPNHHTNIARCTGTGKSTRLKTRSWNASPMQRRSTRC